MKSLLRVWQELDLQDLQQHLIVVGELSCECFSCHEVGIAKSARACPKCQNYFKYMGFRRKVTPQYLRKVKEELPHIILVDFEDFKKSLGQRDARKLLDI